MFLDAYCEIMADQRGQIVQRSFCNTRHTAIMQDKPLLGTFSDTFDFPQGGSHLSLASAVAMVRDSEAVSLIPYPLQYFKSLR